MVAWLIAGAYLSSQFPGVPTSVWIIAFIVVTTFLKIIDLRVTEGVNFLLVAFQLLVLAFFVALSIGYFIQVDTGASLWSPFLNQNTTVAAISAGGAIG